MLYEKKKFLLFSGYNNRAVITICRTLEKLNVDYCIIANGENGFLSKSIYKDKIFHSLANQRLDINEVSQVLEKIKLNYNIKTVIILPTTEYLNRFLLKHRLLLETQGGCEIPLVDQSTYEQISDKESFALLCDRFNIHIPKTYLLNEKTPLPFVAKPKKEFNKENKRTYPYLIFSKEDISNFLKLQNIEDYYFQEFIGGNSVYLLFYFYKDGSYKLMVQQNGGQQPNGKSIFFAWSRLPDNRMQIDKFVELFKSVSYQGLVMVELKGGDKHYCMIEANPRAWGPIQLTSDSHFNLIMCYIEEYLSVKIPPKNFKVKIGIPYFWFNGYLDAIFSKNPITWFKYGKSMFWKKILKLPFHEVYFHKDTFGIFYAEFIQIIKKYLRKQ